MRKTSLLTAVILAAAISGAPQLAAAMGSSNPAPPSESGKPSGKPDAKKNKKDKSSSAKEFLDRYHAAYALIYDKEDYQSGITALRAMGYDDNADVATLLGYASRKLGRYDDAKYWYDKALAADPKHALTWSYYGMWHAEQGNLLKAKDDLEQVRLICGTECKEFVALKEVIDGARTY
ncbi:MAG: tetratricopeptide repeat protein [Xanthobacteraceae bacterium]|jgi:tetratricopeptide (TPR) repeat protein